ncbi:Cell death protease [Imshaugia aleurites]|uniref:Carboxypeptidase n=1 Tax=Imshaugia aleurites TaxID=172621 RepID=A0A8H3EYJ8_9LECA|nr:Cell death protease [Imshaugia aleurites]
MSELRLASVRRHLRPHSFATCIWLSLCMWMWNVSAAQKTAADYYVQSLPGQPDGPLLKMHAGHIEVNAAHNGNLFFWHFQNRHIANRQRTVLWLNGGPGCSSMDGALMEIGPYRLKDESTLRYNDGSWDEFANILFVDNPVGTGFSYVDTDSYVHELKDMADQMVLFLRTFFEMFPEYEDNDLYIAGESYAGQHIPYIAQAILSNNNLPTQSRKWNLSGLLIGNGWISPVEQYDSYLTMAYDAGVIQGGSEEANELEKQHQRCTDALNQPGGLDKVDLPPCESILQSILRLSQKDGQCYNMYDVRLRDSYPSCGMNWPPDLTNVTPYLRRDDVKAALHINKDKKSGWTECSGAVGSNFNAAKSKPTIQILPDILEQVPVILFSGDQDLICNHIGTEELIHNMEWNGGKGFELSPGTWAPRRHWTFEGEPAGLYQEARNLTYILYYNSSHMVPFDYPRRTRDMLDRFLGVDIASIGGKPADSRIDGEKGVETSVGGHPNSTSAEQAEAEKLEEAKWAAYYKSGEVALIVVIILASVWGFYVWRDRRRRAGYDGVFGGSNAHLVRSKRQGRDVEAADFDESELDDLHVASPDPHGEEAQERYSLGEGSSDEEGKGKANGHANGHVSFKD